ncbi:MAG: hypothetical protein KJ950_01930 [Proteobacteria bacterium]|nr:hypothetical protein [Pseudomonadota bacterium]
MNSVSFSDFDAYQWDHISAQDDVKGCTGKIPQERSRGRNNEIYFAMDSRTFLLKGRNNMGLGILRIKTSLLP